MDAKPNVLNKILSAVVRRPIFFRACNGTSTDTNDIFGYELPHDSTKYIMFMAVVPRDFKAGSDWELIFNWGGDAANETGSDKSCVIIPRYNTWREGEVIGSPTTLDAIELVIPDGEAANTLHKSTILTIADLQAGDLISMYIRRDGGAGGDTYTGNLFIALPALGKYTADKIGVT